MSNTRTTMGVVGVVCVAVAARSAAAQVCDEWPGIKPHLCGHVAANDGNGKHHHHYHDSDGAGPPPDAIPGHNIDSAHQHPDNPNYDGYSVWVDESYKWAGAANENNPYSHGFIR